jgi:succinate-semialdehyde dehydrogenase/glutarate-semialdehyde dehydrogenase
VDEIDRAVSSAASAHAFWKGSLFEERKRRLLRLADLVFEQAEDVATLIATEQGKPFVEALTLEVLPALDHLRFLALHAERLTSNQGIEPRQPLYAHKRAHYLYDSIGVIALVTPFNLPFAIPLIQAGAALAMGNSVILKPSERTPLCGLRVGELVIEAGFPPGLVNVLHTAREETLYLVANDKVRKIFVTGSIDTGQQVMVTAGCAPRPVVLSLPGKHPSLVAADAALEQAARGVVWGALANAGQNCGAVERVYVEQRVASRFLELMLAEVDRVKMGGPLEEDVGMGPLISAERRREVHGQVTDAVRSGARLLRGGKIPNGPGFFYPPTVLLGPRPECRLMREETLGPVIPIVVVDSLEQALLLANDSDYALTASGWTKSPATAERLMVGLQAGVVTINDLLYSFGEPASTWSGYRRSGLGHTHGAAGLREMCRQKFASFDPSQAEAPLFGFPYDGQASALARASIQTLHNPRRRRRLGGLLKLIRLKRFRARVPLRCFLPAWKRRSR